MLPVVFGLPSYFLAWGVAAAAGIWLAVGASRRSGIDVRRALPAVVSLAVLLILGAKLQSALDGTLFGSGGGFAWTRGFQVPGGMLAVTLGLPVVACVFRLPTVRIGDAVASIVGVPLAIARAGCFLRGCCFGVRSQAAWAVRFPVGSPAYYWHMEHGWIGGPATASLPVHPLQLYYVALGAGLYVLGRRWARSPHADGAVWRNVTLAYFAATLALELFRQERIVLNLAVCATVLALGVISAALGGRRPTSIFVDGAPASR